MYTVATMALRPNGRMRLRKVPLLASNTLPCQAKMLTSLAISALSKLPNNLVHQPWKATVAQLSEGNVTLGQTYPRPVVDHAKARQAALAAYRRISKSEKEPPLIGE